MAKRKRKRTKCRGSRGWKSRKWRLVQKSARRCTRRRGKRRPSSQYQAFYYNDVEAAELRGLSALCALCGLPWADRPGAKNVDPYGDEMDTPDGTIDDAPICHPCKRDRPVAVQWLVDWVEEYAPRDRSKRGAFRTVLNWQERLHD